ncbi:MAG: hypothetical protein KAT52_07400 [Desulfobacterales bacterium]|nr:hypothetical protein [Desulfobacterales bacterium]
MDISSASPSLFDIIKFTIEVILIGGLGLAWKIIRDWQKQVQDLQKEQREYLLSVAEPALEFEANVAVKVAFEYYRPVLDAIRGVDVYAETYEIAEETISAAKEFQKTGHLPDDVRDIVRDALERYESQKLQKSMEQALPSAAQYLCYQLDVLHKAVENLIKEGYLWELEEGAGRDNLITFLNFYHAADIPVLVKDSSPSAVSKFLKEWQSSKLAPIKALRVKLPWHEFVADYYKKLTEGHLKVENAYKKL